MAETLKPVAWIRSSRRDLRAMPLQVRRDIGQALYAAQRGEMDPAAKPLKGFGGSKVLEIVDDYQTNTYRGVYTVQFREMIYVLHVFQKKSKQGKATPPKDIALIKRRLKEAENDYRERQN